MPYPYGTQLAPAVGNGLPGLPQRSSAIGGDPASPPLMRVYLRAVDGPQQAYLTPDWATFARVTAIAKGGRGRGGTAGLPTSSDTGHGGGGASCSGTNQEAVSAGVTITASFDDDATRVQFLNYSMIAGNGADATAAGPGLGGIASGGAVNFNGGNGAASSTGTTAISRGAGGAAGRGGNGVNATTDNNGGSGGLGDAYTSGGGPGGAGGGAGTVGTAGFQGAARADTCLLGATILGRPMLNPIATLDGGDPGGGSGGSKGTTSSNIPGAALVLIELW